MRRLAVTFSGEHGVYHTSHVDGEAEDSLEHRIRVLVDVVARRSP